jgi:hypothetical protein
MSRANECLYCKAKKKDIFIFVKKIRYVLSAFRRENFLTLILFIAYSVIICSKGNINNV